MTPSSRLRTLLTDHAPVVAPGAYDGLSALLVEQAAFPAVYASGGAIARSTGIPDLGLLTMTEVVDRIGSMVDVLSVPLIADADTGYGGTLNVRHAVKAFQRVGVAGIHLEDQAFPKRCGHYDDKALISSEEMCHKLRAVREVSTDPDFVLIARTDALAVEGYAATISRCHSYMHAGADVIFVEAPTSEAEIEQIARDLPYPKLINMFHGGKTPLMPVDRLAALGFAIIIIPSDTQRAAIAAMQRTLQAIRRDGHSGAIAEEMTSFGEREKIIGTNEYLKLA